MNELHRHSNAELVQVATSKNYGKSTRTAARKILAERGVAIDDRTFANPSRGDVPLPPPDTGGRAFLTLARIIIGLVIIGFAYYLRMRSRYS